MDEQGSIVVRVTGVYMHQEEGKPPQHFVLLRGKDGRRMPIWTGQFEAWAISFALEGEPTERPMTHDMMLMIIEATGATVTDAAINDIRDETFYSTVTLRLADGTEKILDVRPSDAIAVALRVKCPIRVAQHVFEATARRD